MYDKESLVAWDDGQGLGDDEITRDMVVDWLERFADLSGIKVIATSNAAVLARAVQDFHEKIKDITTMLGNTCIPSFIV